MAKNTISRAADFLPHGYKEEQKERLRKELEPKSVPVVDPEKAARVEQERARLLELFAGADPNRLDFIRETVNQLAWLAVSIQDLQNEVDEKGPVLPYMNGKNQTGVQANPACKLLIDYEKLHNTAFRALLPVLPDKVKGPDKLAEFRREFDLELDTDNV